MGLLGRLGAIAGKTLKTVGAIGGAALKPLGVIAGSAAARNIANRVIDAAPLPNALKGVAKGAVEAASSYITSGKAAQFIDRVKNAGARVEQMTAG